MTMRAPHFGPRAVANSRGSVLAVVAVAVTLSEGWINVLALPLDHARWLALGLHVLQSQATLSVVLSAGLIDALRSATKKESYQLCRSALRSTRIEVSHRSTRSACGI